jgi:hypothetical protein
MVETTTIKSIITEQRDTMLEELVDIIVDKDTSSTVMNVADSVINASMNDSVKTGMINAINNDSCFTGVLYSVNFNNFHHTIIVNITNDVCKIYPISNVTFTDEVFDLNDYEDIVEEYWKGYGKEMLMQDIQETLDEYVTHFKDEIEKELSIAILRIKYLSIYGRALNKINNVGGENGHLFTFS